MDFNFNALIAIQMESLIEQESARDFTQSYDPWPTPPPIIEDDGLPTHPEPSRS